MDGELALTYDSFLRSVEWKHLKRDIVYDSALACVYSLWGLQPRFQFTFQEVMIASKWITEREEMNQAYIEKMRRKVDYRFFLEHGTALFVTDFVKHIVCRFISYRWSYLQGNIEFNVTEGIRSFLNLRREDGDGLIRPFLGREDGDGLIGLLASKMSGAVMPTAVSYFLFIIYYLEEWWRGKVNCVMFYRGVIQQFYGGVGSIFGTALVNLVLGVWPVGGLASEVLLCAGPWLGFNLGAQFVDVFVFNFPMRDQSLELLQRSELEAGQNASSLPRPERTEIG